MNADEDEKDAKRGSSGQANSRPVGATNQPAKRRTATKRAPAAAKKANGGKTRSSEQASPNVAARQAFEDLVRELGGPAAAMKALEAIVMSRSSAARQGRKGSGPKRAICLAGGGPAAGLHIGVLKGLRDAGITFDTKNDVWALSCIGAWVGVIYNQAENDRIQETTNFFRDVFREDKSFDSFPLNTIFTPDWAGNADAMWEF